MTYIVPSAAPSPAEDDALENFLHDVIVGVVGIKGGLVRPRWQPEPPNLPAAGTDWIAFGIMGFEGDFSGAVMHNPAGDGNDEFSRHETIKMLVSAYGKNAGKNMRLLRDGLQLSQNRSAMFDVGMGLQETGDITPAPVLIKEMWTHRFDMNVTLRRQVRRSYPVLSLLSLSDGSYIDNEKYQTPLIVTG